MKKLQELREAKQVSKSEIARFLGITRQAYANYENGFRTPNAKVLEKLAVYYQVKIDDLLDYEPSANSIVYLEPPEFTGLMKEAYGLLKQLPDHRKRHYIRMFEEDIAFIRQYTK